jgi:hypothetical protein
VSTRPKCGARSPLPLRNGPPPSPQLLHSVPGCVYLQIELHVPVEQSLTVTGLARTRRDAMTTSATSMSRTEACTRRHGIRYARAQLRPCAARRYQAKPAWLGAPCRRHTDRPTSGPFRRAPSAPTLSTIPEPLPPPYASINPARSAPLLTIQTVPAVDYAALPHYAI